MFASSSARVLSATACSSRRSRSSSANPADSAFSTSPNARYRVGAGDLRAVQQQALALHAARTALLRVQAERLVQRVNLHLALGGGWSNQ